MAERTPIDRAADVLLYAPVGLLASVRTLLPELASRGRQELGGQVTVARMVGELAVRQGQRQAGEVLDRARHQAEAVIDTILAQVADQDVLPEPSDAPPAAASEAPTVVAEPVPAPASEAPTVVAEPVPAPAAGADPAAAPDEAAPVVPDVDDLAIPGYASLAASQVVPRLAGLGPEELEAVRAYEVGTRRRRTILTRIAQLQAR